MPVMPATLPLVSPYVGWGLLAETIPEWGQTARSVKEYGRAEAVDGDAMLPANTQLAPILEWSPC